jgi:uncharacterized protein (TIGR02996 family)
MVPSEMEGDIGTTPAALELQRAIANVPDDDAPQLVLADLLQAAGDPRGELIVLDLRERVGDLVDADGLTRLLFLAAEYSFPRARPDDPALPFTGYGSRPPRYATRHDGKVYDVRYRDRTLVVFADAHPRPLLRVPLELAAPDAWAPDEAAPILRLLGDAIRAGTPLDELQPPFMRAPLPTYDGGPLRGYRLPKRFRVLHGLAANRYGLAPRDYFRWNRIWNRLAGQ